MKSLNIEASAPDSQRGGRAVNWDESWPVRHFSTKRICFNFQMKMLEKLPEDVLGSLN